MTIEHLRFYALPTFPLYGGAEPFIQPLAYRPRSELLASRLTEQAAALHITVYSQRLASVVEFAGIVEICKRFKILYSPAHLRRLASFAAASSDEGDEDIYLRILHSPTALAAVEEYFVMNY